MTIKHGFVKPLWLILASYFRTTVRNGYNTVLLDQIYVKLGILTYIAKWDVPCLVVKIDRKFQSLVEIPWHYLQSKVRVRISGVTKCVKLNLKIVQTVLKNFHIKLKRNFYSFHGKSLIFG